MVHAETETSTPVGERVPTLPTYSMAEVAKHTTKEKGTGKKKEIYIYVCSAFFPLRRKQKAFMLREFQVNLFSFTLHDVSCSSRKSLVNISFRL